MRKESWEIAKMDKSVFVFKTILREKGNIKFIAFLSPLTNKLIADKEHV
jgi:hypothetical protein